MRSEYNARSSYQVWRDLVQNAHDMELRRLRARKQYQQTHKRDKRIK